MSVRLADGGSLFRNRINYTTLLLWVYIFEVYSVDETPTTMVVILRPVSWMKDVPSVAL